MIIDPNSNISNIVMATEAQEQPHDKMLPSSSDVQDPDLQPISSAASFVADTSSKGSMAQSY